MRNRVGKTRYALPLVAMLLAGKAWAQAADGPPVSPLPAELAARVTFTKILADTARAGALVIRLEHTRLSVLRKSYPALKIHHHGDAGHSETWACATVGSPVGDVRVWPSSSELQGVDVIDSVMLQRADAPPTADCPRIATAPAAPGLDDGVAISMVRSGVISRLGTPGAAVGGVLYYGYLTAPGAHGKRGCAVSGAVTAGFLARRVDRIWASRDTAC
jgi:hypothetical protein